MHLSALLGFVSALAALLLGGCVSSAPRERPSPVATRFKAQIDAQRPDEVPLPDTVYSRASPMPRALNYQAAYAALLDYPRGARDVVGRVVVQFVVSKNGWPVEPEVIQKLHPEIDAEVLEVVRYLRFEPGRRGGAPVAVRMRQPFSFGRGNPGSDS